MTGFLPGECVKNPALPQGGFWLLHTENRERIPPKRSGLDGKKSDLAEKLLEILNDLHFDLCGRTLFEYEFQEKNHLVVHG
jgi:hypothetical protein